MKLLPIIGAMAATITAQEFKSVSITRDSVVAIYHSYKDGECLGGALAYRCTAPTITRYREVWKPIGGKLVHVLNDTARIVAGYTVPEQVVWP